MDYYYNLIEIYGADKVGLSRSALNANFAVLDTATNNALVKDTLTGINFFIYDYCIGTEINFTATESTNLYINDVLHVLTANVTTNFVGTVNVLEIVADHTITVVYKRDPTITYNNFWNLLVDKMSLSLDETVNGVKNFTNGILAGGVYVNGTVPIPTDKGSGVTMGYSTAAAMHRLLAWTGSTYAKLGIGAYSGGKVSAEFNTDGTVKFNFNVTAPNIAYKSAVSSYTLVTWSGSTAPYTITIPVTGATATNIIEVVPNYDTITDEQLTALKAAQIDKITQTTGNITLYAYGTKPTVSIPIKTILRGDA